mmetsp:Transcript_15426/g.33480  ORF Transcript_15426/g.33480 Transcript_15426/m.33480 type:complete len:233 (+) Transcript_15426:347-1045(+)
MWQDLYVDVVFRDVCAWTIPDTSAADGRTFLPFEEYADLYMWHVVGTANIPPSDTSHTSLPTIGRVCTIHRAGSTEHVASLPTDDAAAAMHRRLHCSAAHLRRLPTMCADAPASLARTRHVGCAACTEANATRASYSSDHYEPSYAGRLVHADIAGPFNASSRGKATYLLVLVDDHSRFKGVCFLKRKSDAPECIRKVVARVASPPSSTEAKHPHRQSRLTSHRERRRVSLS